MIMTNKEFNELVDEMYCEIYDIEDYNEVLECVTKWFDTVDSFKRVEMINEAMYRELNEKLYTMKNEVFESF